MEVIRQLPLVQIPAVLTRLPPREAAELLAQFPVQQQQEILQAMPPEWRGKLLARAALHACGNGMVEEGEQCESSLFDPSLPYQCVNCRFLSQFCGDGKMNPGEECDDGNRLPGDGCDGSCRGEISTVPPSTLVFLPSPRLPSSPLQGQDYSWKTRRLPRQTTETGPELIAIMAAGAAGGWAFMRRGWRRS